MPLAVAIAVGRVGCFLTGLADHTCGSPTTLPWGVDFGDGIARHPTQLYEALFLLGLAGLLSAWRRRAPATGDLFRGFVAGYFAFRLAVDSLKPAACRGLGLTSIQWVAALALTVLVPDMLRWFRTPKSDSGGV